MRAFDIMLSLIRHEISGVELSDEVKKAITPECLYEVYKRASMHDLAHLVGDALDIGGLLEEGSEAKKKFVQARDIAVYRYRKLQYEQDRVTQLLESEKLRFIPLKGAIVRNYYPKPWMRTSCDIDILLDKENIDAARDALIEKLGYKSDGAHTNHDISLYSPSGVHLELHYDLLDDDRRGEQFVYDIWNYTYREENRNFHLLLTDEAFYFYHVLHMVKHFKDGGCGVRPLLDLWILNHMISYDKAKRDEMFAKFGFAEFALAAERLCDVWFSGAEYDELMDNMEQFILTGGVYGSSNNRIALRQTKAGSKSKYLLSRIFISSEALRRKYPILKKHPYLIPIYHIRRWLKLIFNPNIRKRSKREFTYSSKACDNADKTQELINRLEL